MLKHSIAAISDLPTFLVKSSPIISSEELPGTRGTKVQSELEEVEVDDSRLPPVRYANQTPGIAAGSPCSRGVARSSRTWPLRHTSHLHRTEHFFQQLHVTAIEENLHPPHSRPVTLPNALATFHLSLILPTWRVCYLHPKVRPRELDAQEEDLVALPASDAITISPNMRRCGPNLELNNTSPALDQDPHAHSGIIVQVHKSNLLSGCNSAKMPALLASDDVQATARGAKRSTRLIGAPPSTSVHVRKGLRSHRSSSTSVSWQVQRLTVNRSLTIDNWRVGGVLGNGTYGKVYHVYNKLSGAELAMKVVDIRDPIPGIICDGLLTELLVLETLSRTKRRRPFLLYPTKERSWAWRSSEGFMYMMTELCPGGELWKHAGKISGYTLKLVIAELAIAIESLHRLGIVHHDLKPENVLIDADGHCVLADYGSAKMLAPDGTLSLDIHEDVLATLPYAAPELISPDCDEDGVKYYDETIDWWALGALIMYLVMGKEYFTGRNMDELLDDMPWLIEHIPATLEGYGCSDELIDFVLGLLTMDSNCRMDYTAMREHEYFDDLDWDMLEVRSSKITAPFPPVREVVTYRAGSHEVIDCPDISDEEGYDFVADLAYNGLELQVDDSLTVPS